MDTVLLSLFNRKTQIAALAELIGTFFLTMTALLVMPPQTPLAVGLALVVLVYAIGNTSGCHINPAVTIGLVAGRRFPLGPGVMYVVAQVLGALIARLLAGLVGDLQPDYQAAGVVAEFVGFALLILTVAAVYENEVPKAGSGIAIGGALATGLLFSKGILNPAVAIAMGETFSAATWATIVSGVAGVVLFKVFKNINPPS
jgi:aquaporin Z